MANNFTSLWNLAFSWLGTLLRMPLPIYFGSTALCMLDIIVGTVGIFVAFAAVRALLKSGFTIAGKDLIGEPNVKTKIQARRMQEHENRVYDSVSSSIDANGGSVDADELRRKGLL